MPFTPTQAKGSETRRGSICIQRVHPMYAIHLLACLEAADSRSEHPHSLTRPPGRQSVISYLSAKSSVFFIYVCGGGLLHPPSISYPYSPSFFHPTPAPVDPLGRSPPLTTKERQRQVMSLNRTPR
ncbi:hypothetical protein FRC18_004093 [Serendipita sp. 400]|nr:hypothetical protein FRC18_004093 [Serendipita sp. 400]